MYRVLRPRSEGAERVRRGRAAGGQQLGGPRNLALQNNVRERLLGSVRDGERDIFVAELGSDGGGLPVKLQGGALAFRPDNFDIPPAHAMAPAGADGLHARFLGGEARGIALKASDLGLAVTNFALSEN